MGGDGAAGVIGLPTKPSSPPGTNSSSIAFAEKLGGVEGGYSWDGAWDQGQRRPSGGE